MLREVSGACAALLVLAGCSGVAGGGAASPQVVTVTATPSPQAPSPSVPTGSPPGSPAPSDIALGGMTDEEASQEFLALVCPTDTALQILGNVSLAADGWGKVQPKDARPYAEAAIEQASRAAQQLEQFRPWPANVADDMPEVSQEYLQMLTPLQRIASASDGEAMKDPWLELRALPRTAEQSVRLTLGLGIVASPEDGCPPAPEVPRRSADVDDDDAQSASGSGSWTTLWQSPSGNLRCGFSPEGSLGVPVAACLDSDTNTLARLPKGYYPAITSATTSQRAQLSGGFVLDFGETVSDYGFTCTLLDPQGMTCRDLATGQGFSIRRGVAYPL